MALGNGVVGRQGKNTLTTPGSAATPAEIASVVSAALAEVVARKRVLIVRRGPCRLACAAAHFLAGEAAANVIVGEVISCGRAHAVSAVVTARGTAVWRCANDHSQAKPAFLAKCGSSQSCQRVRGFPWAQDQRSCGHSSKRHPCRNPQNQSDHVQSSCDPDSRLCTCQCQCSTRCRWSRWSRLRTSPLCCTWHHMTGEDRPQPMVQTVQKQPWPYEWARRTH